MTADEHHSSKYVINYFRKAKLEYERLDGSQKVFVNKGLARISRLGMQAGQPLKGDLSLCRKLKNKKMGLRIVFTQDGEKINVIQIVAIGQRADKIVYHFSNLSGLLKIWLSRAKAWDSKHFFYIGISIEVLNDLWPLANIFDLWKLKI